MSYKITEIEGIGPVHAETLSTAHITTTDELLKLCCDKAGRMAVSDKTKIPAAKLLKWANMADLMRINGVAEEYSELLELSGVDTVKELATRRADNLAAKVKKINDEKNCTRSCPSESVLTKWIDQAKAMPAVITH